MDHKNSLSLVKRLQVQLILGNRLIRYIRGGEAKNASALLLQLPHLALYAKSDNTRSTALLEACRAANATLVHDVLEAATRLGELRTCLEARAGPADGGVTALLQAARANKPALVTLLMSYGADPTAADSSGQTCFHIAAANGWFKILEILVYFPVSDGAALVSDTATPDPSAPGGTCRLIDKRDGAGFTALHLAALNNFPRALQTLVEGGASLDLLSLRDAADAAGGGPECPAGSNALHLAAASGSGPEVQYLVEVEESLGGLGLREAANGAGMIPRAVAIQAQNTSLASFLDPQLDVAQYATDWRRRAIDQRRSSLDPLASKVEVLRRCGRLLEALRAAMGQGPPPPRNSAPPPVLAGGALSDPALGLSDMAALQSMDPEEVEAIAKTGPGRGPGTGTGTPTGVFLTDSEAGSAAGSTDNSPRASGSVAGGAGGASELPETLLSRLSLWLRLGGSSGAGPSRFARDSNPGSGAASPGPASPSRSDAATHGSPRPTTGPLLGGLSGPGLVVHTTSSGALSGASSPAGSLRGRGGLGAAGAAGVGKSRLGAVPPSTSSAALAAQGGAAAEARDSPSCSQASMVDITELEVELGLGSAAAAAAAAAAELAGEAPRPSWGRGGAGGAGGAGLGRGLSDAGSPGGAATPSGKGGSKGLTPPPGDESACGVCMDRAADIQITSCTHALCYRCALKICTNTSAGPTCPFCRTPLDGFERACPWGAGRGRGDAATPTPPPPQAGGVSDTAAP